jgi:hypothetical protein
MRPRRVIMGDMAAPRIASYAQTAQRVVAPGDPSIDAPTGPDPAEHDATVVERGSFARAVCTTCDWHGPARRARAYATADIEEHRLLGATPLTVDLRDRG